MLIALLILIGLFFFPRITLGCILIAFGHPIIGVIAIILGMFIGMSNED